MSVSKAFIWHLKDVEGLSYDTYYDSAGVLTIGFGFTNRSTSFVQWQRDNGFRLTPDAAMSMDQIEDALHYIIHHEYGKYVTDQLGNLPQHQYDACVSVVYNAGERALSWRWARQLRRGNVRTAAALLTTTAITAGGRKLAGLVNRRYRESRMLLGEQTVRRGSRGYWVAVLQDRLSLTVDGSFGRGTEAAVRRYQYDNRLTEDGIVGKKTWAKL